MDKLSSVLMVPVRRPLTVSDWMIAISIALITLYGFFAAIGSQIAETPSEWFARASFMIFIGIVGVPITIFSASYFPIIIPAYLAVLALWAGMLIVLKRLPLRRAIQIAFLIFFFVSFWISGSLGLALTQLS